MKLGMLILPLCLFATAGEILAFSTGPPPERTGAAADGGLFCTACHRGNDPNDGKGNLTILVRDYVPGVKQKVKVMLTHPDALRWGFQLSARLASDPTKQAGTFAVTDITRVRCPDGSDAPCNGQREFVEHGATGTYRGQTGGASWEFEWTPPATASGDIVFYAAGNAANNNGTNAGDFIYTTSKTITARNCQMTGTPRITGIRSAASFLDGPYAMGGLITIGGSGFQPAGQNNSAESIDIIDGAFPKQLACLAVEVAGSRSPILFANPVQINTQIPVTTQLGTVPVRVIANPGQPNEIRSDAVNITLVPNGPAFFRVLPTPCIAAVLPNGSISGDPSLLPYMVPAKVGDVLALYATGLGQVDPVWQAGEVTAGQSTVKTPISIEWNGTVMAASDVLYVGLAPGAISGLYQINIKVPAVAKSGVHNNVRIRQGSVLSPEGTTLYIQ